MTGAMSKPASFFRASGRVAAATLLTRLFGLARDMTVAHLFGASAALDAFFVAFKIPNFLRRLFAEGAFAQGLVPMISQSAQPEALFQSLWTGIILLGGLVTLIAECFAPFWVHCFAPGFVHIPAQFALAVDLFRITFPFLFFVLISALFSAALNIRYCFGWPALAPIWLNLTTLLAACFLRKYLAVPVAALAWGIAVGGCLQVLFLWLLLKRCAWPLWPGAKAKLTEVLRVMRNTLPGVIGVSIAQMGLVIDVIFASYLPAGSISWLFYSDRLVSLPLGIIGVAVSSAMLPYLSHYQSTHGTQAYRRTLDAGLRLILVFGLPAALGLVMLSGPITATVFKSGQFTSDDVLQAQACLAAFAYGLPGIMIIKVLVAAINATQRFRLPCIIALLALLVNVVGAWLLMPALHHVGLAFATTIAIWVNAIGVMIYALKQLGWRWLLAWRLLMLRLLCALTVMGLWLAWWSPTLSIWLGLPYFTRWLHLLVLIISAIMVFAVSLFIAGVRKLV